MTDAERRAKYKYRDKGKQMQLMFYPTELALYEWIEAQGAKQTYIKDLIRKDMESRK